MGIRFVGLDVIEIHLAGVPGPLEFMPIARNMRRFALFLAVFFFMFPMLAARAQTPSPFASWQNDAGVVLRGLQGPIKTWEVYVGGGPAVLPDYIGSNHYMVEPAPAIDIRYKDLAFLTTDEGAGVNLLHGHNYRAGVEIGYDTGRSQHVEQALNGTGSIPPAPVVRAFGEFFILPFVAKADVQRAIGGSDGTWADFGVYAPVVGSRKMVVFVGPSVTLADDRYMQRYFGTGTTQAIPNSRFPAFKAQGGLANANFGVTAIYHLSKYWLINGDVTYERLLGSAAESPIVETKDQVGVSLQIGYEF